MNFVQGAFTDQSATGTTTAVTLSGQGAGNTNIVCCGQFSTTTSITEQSLVDTQGNVYQLIAGPIISSGQGPIYVFLSSGIKGGANTITVTWSATVTFTEIIALEYSGNAMLDGSSVSTISASGSSLTSLPIQALLIGDMLFAYWRQNGAGSTTTPTGFTLRTASVYGQAYDFLNAPQGIYAPVFSVSISAILALSLSAIQPFPSSYYSTGYGVGRIQ
jgi:hypothetical protein